MKKSKIDSFPSDFDIVQIFPKIVQCALSKLKYFKMLFLCTLDMA